MMPMVYWRWRVEDDWIADAGVRQWRTWRWRGCTERELIFNEDNTTRGVGSACGDVVAPVSTVIAWVANEDACDRPGTERVRGGRRGVGAAEAPEHAELVVAWR
jgi:hypothetical protein